MIALNNEVQPTIIFSKNNKIQCIYVNFIH